MNRKIKHNTHPGELFKEEIINAYGLTITEVAEMLGVTRPAISNLVNEKAGMNPMRALRIAKVFGGNAALWVRMQATYDLREAESNWENIKLKPYKHAQIA